MKIKQIYNKLYSSFGPQGWWPVTPTGCRGPESYPIYGISTRTDKQRFEIMVGAILTQNTSWKNVEKAVINLNKNNLIDIGKIKNIKIDKLASIIQPSGYYNQKARTLKNLVNFIIQNGNISKIKDKKTEDLRQELLSVKGIGPETADSILLYALGKPIFVIDAYTKRIIKRIGYSEESYEELQKLFMAGLDNDTKLFNEYHALLVELGKRHCKKKAECEGCPVKKQCKKQ